jgi:hypothetical protein
MEDKQITETLARLRSEVRKLGKEKPKNLQKETNPFTGIVSGNYWTQTGNLLRIQ